MKIKKLFGNVCLTLISHGTNCELKESELLKDIIVSISKIKFINKNKKFDELVELQQANDKWVLVNFEPNYFDECRYIARVISNFLIVTEQQKLFGLLHLEIAIDEMTSLIFDDTESSKTPMNDTCSFSPKIRSLWSKPSLIEQILRS